MRTASTIVSGLSKGVSAASRVSSPIRTFAVMTTAVPKVLSDEMTRRLRYDEVRLVMPPKAKAVAEMAKEAESLLRKSAASGSAEAETFLDDVETARVNPEVTAVFVKGLPSKEELAIYCSAIVSHMLGYAILDQESPVKPVARLKSVGRTTKLLPHQDYGMASDKKGLKIDLLSVVGIDSDGKIETYVIEVNDIRKNLSPRALEILSQPFFIATDYEFMKSIGAVKKESDFHFPVFSKDERGAQRMFLGYDFYGFDPETKAVSVEEGKASVQELYEVIEGICKRGEVKKFNITSGTELVIFNDRCLHGRGLLLDKGDGVVGHEGTTRVVDVISYSKLARHEKGKPRLS